MNISGGTISGNSAVYGSGIYNSGNLRLNNVSLMSNSAKIIGISIQSQSQVMKGNTLVIKSYLTYGDNVASAIYTNNNNIYLNNARSSISNKVPYKNIILKFNNKKYSAKTNSSGIATFNINIPKSSNSGTFKAIVIYSFKGKTFTKTKNVKITSEKINSINNKKVNKPNTKVSAKINKNTGKTTTKVNTKSNSKKTTTKKTPAKIKKIKSITKSKAKNYVNRENKKSKPKNSKKTFKEAYDYKNKNMTWFTVANNKTIDNYPAGLRWTTRSTNSVIKYGIMKKPKNKSTYNKNTKVTTTIKYSVVYNIKNSKNQVIMINTTKIKQNSTKLYNKYLEPSLNAEVKNSRIASFVKNITNNTKSDDFSTKATKIYRWVQVNIDYSLDDDVAISAIAVLNKRSSNGKYKAYCVGFSNVMAALCRSAGIPVRFHGKIFLDLKEYPFEGHAAHLWTEIYINGSWISADAATDGFIASFADNDNFDSHNIKTDKGGESISHNNTFNYFDHTCNHIYQTHKDTNLKFLINSPFNLELEYLKFPITSINNSNQAYNILTKYIDFKGNNYNISSVSYVSGDYIFLSNFISNIWAFHLYEKINNVSKFLGYVIIGVDGSLYPFYGTSDNFPIGSNGIGFYITSS
ncbi:hypothetical protein SDC9_39104 [bioreactor metagenome]|uniref:Transglutaminase-like domain-containing protein n=1 Tax=bioreactor metagenome TaxID=1076179 RepID=A0A644VP56_9ZZZZ